MTKEYFLRDHDQNVKGGILWWFILILLLILIPIIL